MQTTAGSLRLHDPRRFGAVVYAVHEEDAGARKLLGRLGVEPLGDDFDALAFHAALQLRQTAIKQVLLGGEIVVGVGNIYASEALFMAGIRPTVRAARISKPRAARLHAAIREVLARAVAKGGSTLRIFPMPRDKRLFPLRPGSTTVQACPVRCADTDTQHATGPRSTFFCSTARNPETAQVADGRFECAML